MKLRWRHKGSIQNFDGETSWKTASWKTEKVMGMGGGEVKMKPGKQVLKDD
jgi:hypothetical protein